MLVLPKLFNEIQIKILTEFFLTSQDNSRWKSKNNAETKKVWGGHHQMSKHILKL